MTQRTTLNQQVTSKDIQARVDAFFERLNEHFESLDEQVMMARENEKWMDDMLTRMELQTMMEHEVISHDGSVQVKGAAVGE